MQDLRYGWRQLRNAPVFTLTALISLGLGIGASVTMFSAFRAVFLRSLPYRDADRLVDIEKIGDHGYTPGNTVADLEFFRRYAHSFQSAARYGYFRTVTLSGIQDPADLWVRDVSPELFPLLGAKPLIGRTFLASDFRSEAPQTAVLAYSTWQKYFRGDPEIVGHTVFLNEQSYVVVGIMPQGFDFPRMGTAAWLADRTPVTDPQKTYGAIVARMRDGVSLNQCREEVNRLTPALLQKYSPADRHFRLKLYDVATQEIEDYRTAFLVLLAATGFLVLLACLNIASLLFARAAARREEFSIRGALGAGRARLMGQVLTESLMIAGLGGVLGIALAYAGNRILLTLLPPYLRIPRLEQTHLDFEVLGFAVLLTFVVALAFGVFPALELSSARFSVSHRHSRTKTWRYGAVSMLEIAAALILFAGSILMIRAFVRLVNVDPGFRTAHVLTAGVPPGHAARLTRDQQAQRYKEILRVAQSVPGVEQAALTSYLPLGHVRVQLQIYLPERTSAHYQVDFHAVSANYFSAMGIPLLRGRLFSQTNPNADKGAAVVDRTMADKFWPGADPIGQHLGNGLTVIGVVGDTRHGSLGGEPVPEFYENYEQYLGPAVGTTLVLRTFGDPRSVASSLRQAIHRFDPEQVIENETTMQAAVEQSIAAPRFYTILLGVFAVIALVLTLIGVYGVASYGTSLRTREFGIRMALGAERERLIRMVLRQGLRRALIGLIAGAIGAWMLARFMAGLVYGIPVRDPVSLAIAAGILLAGALVAYYMPARRSTKVDPATVLREE